MNVWQTKKLGEVSSVGAGNSAPQKDSLFRGGKYPFFRTSDVGQIHVGVLNKTTDYLNEKGIKGMKLFPEGTILIPKSGASTFLNHRVIMAVDGYVSSHLATIKTNEKYLSAGFLFYFLQEIKAQDLIQDHKYPSLNLSIIENIKVPLPPLREQKRIVKKLDEIFMEISRAESIAEKNLQNSKTIFQTSLDKTFSGLRKDWEKTTLEKVLALQPRNGWSPPAVHHSDFGVPVLTLSSVTGFTFRGDKIKYTSAKTDPSRHYWVKNNDLLITRSNTPELVGHVAIASGIVEPTIYPDLIMRMNPALNRMLTKFLYYQLRTSSLRREIIGRAQGANPTMKKISKSAVQTLPIVVPPLPTQKVIIKKLDTLSVETKKLEEIYKQKIKSLEELKKSVLSMAFSGEL